MEHLARTGRDVEEALAHVGEVVGGFKIERLSPGRVNEITVHDLVGETNSGAPAFQYFLHPGVLFDMGIEVEVRADVRTQILQVEAPEFVDESGIGGQVLESIALGRGIADDLAQDQLQVLPVQVLGLLDVLGSQPKRRHPLCQDGLSRPGNLRNGRQGGGKNQDPDVITPVQGRGGIPGKEGRRV